jgi:hypothetical protein
MMNSRNKILLAALVVQLVLVITVNRLDQRPATAEHSFFSALVPSEIRAMTITDENRGVIRLAREEQGWMIAGASAPEGVATGDLLPTLEPPIPADDAKVQIFIRRLAELKSDRLVSRTRTSQARLKVAEEQFVRRIELTNGDGRTSTLFLGSSPSFKTIHLRAGNESEVYLAEGLTNWEANTQFSTWWENDYLNLEPEELRAVTFINPQGSFRLIRSEESGWRLADAAAGEQVSTVALEEFLYRIGYISLLDYLGREGAITEATYGLDKPEARIILDNADRQTEVRIGPEQEESGQRVVKSSASPFYAKVASYSLKSILEQKRADLLLSDEESEMAEALLAE